MASAEIKLKIVYGGVEYVRKDIHEGAVVNADRLQDGFNQLTDALGIGDSTIGEVVDSVERVLSDRDGALKSKDSAYAERDKVVAAFACLAKSLGWPVWLRRHVGEWDDDWRNIVFIDTPFGQMSWHYHDSEREWFSMHGGEGEERPVWDGHTTEEKYARLLGLVRSGGSGTP